MTDGSRESEDTLDGHGVPAVPAVQPSVGTVVGRYVVVDRLGAGAMGVVYTAWDPELDRRVALKLLHDGARSSSQGRSRLVLEAQALARLAHPNVVAVHDVGTLDDRLWIAMEFVQGATLDRWLRCERRGWRETLSTLCDAGRGLAAAHAAGLVHRDFKPENVMVGDDGRVRVMDFGLARAPGPRLAEPPPSSNREGTTLEPEGSPSTVSLTRTGAAVGTPAYMAPEQHARGLADMRSDQFSFCVSLWEALYGERPFAGATLVALATNVLVGNIRPPPAKAIVPTWLRRAIERGLSIDPDARWPSMDALLGAFARGRARERQRRPVAVVGVLGLGIVGVVAAREIGERRRAAACARDSAGLIDAWNGPVRDHAEQSIRDSALPDAALAATRIVAAVDRDAARWADAHNEACLDAEVRDRWDADTFARAQWCLDEQRVKIQAFIDQLADPGLDTVRAALAKASHDRHIERCRDPERLARLPPPPEASREAVRAIRAELARITTLVSKDGYEPALAVARAELARAEEIGWTPLVAEARSDVADLLARLGRFEEAEAGLEDTYFEAARAGALEIARDAATALVYDVGYNLARPIEGMRWSREAELVLARLGEEGGDGHAALLSARAAVEFRQGDLAAARRDETAALAIRERVFPPDHPDIAASLGNLANVEGVVGNLELQRSLLERAVAIEEAALGPGDPLVGRLLVSLGNAQRELGRLDEAELLVSRGLAVQEKALGQGHPDIAKCVTHLAAVYSARGDFVRTRVLIERAVAIVLATSGPDHPEYGLALGNLASTVADLGDLTEARTLHERALANFEAAFGPEHLDVAAELHALADLELRAGNAAKAVGLAERALAILERSGDPGGLPRTRFVLAQALWADVATRGLAIEQAERATRELDAAPDDALANEVGTWLDDRGDKFGRTITNR